LDKKVKFVFECKYFRIGYQKDVHKPEKKQIQDVKPKLIEERRIDTYV